MAEAVVGKAQGLGKHPALAVVLCEESLDALVAVAAAGADLLFEVVKGDERQDRVAQLGVLVLVDAPEPVRRKRFVSDSLSERPDGQTTIGEHECHLAVVNTVYERCHSV